MDDKWGLMDIYQGVIDDSGVLVLDNIRSGTYFPLPNEQKLNFRFSIELASCTRTTEIDMSADQGLNWQPWMRIKYKQQQEECSN